MTALVWGFADAAGFAENYFPEKLCSKTDENILLLSIKPLANTKCLFTADGRGCEMNVSSAHVILFHKPAPPKNHFSSVMRQMWWGPDDHQSVFESENILWCGEPSVGRWVVRIGVQSCACVRRFCANGDCEMQPRMHTRAVTSVRWIENNFRSKPTLTLVWKNTTTLDTTCCEFTTYTRRWEFCAASCNVVRSRTVHIPLTPRRTRNLRFLSKQSSIWQCEITVCNNECFLAQGPRTTRTDSSRSGIPGAFELTPLSFTGTFPAYILCPSRSINNAYKSLLQSRAIGMSVCLGLVR